MTNHHKGKGNAIYFPSQIAQGKEEEKMKKYKVYDKVTKRFLGIMEIPTAEKSRYLEDFILREVM